MTGIDWKAEAKALQKKLDLLRATLKGAARPVAGRLHEAATGVAADIAAAAREAGRHVSPLAPPAFPDLPRIAGAEFATARAGIKYPDRADVMLVRLAPGSVIAGAFTRSSTRSAAVRDCAAKISDDAPAEGDASGGAAIIVNSGNANAFTGARGDETVAEVTRAVAEALDLVPGRVFSSSTGVISEPLAGERITAVLPSMIGALDEGAIHEAARAIMTTDTFAKGAFARVNGAGGPINIAGIAKGSGMIAPDMGTMLAYIFTDARIARSTLQAMIDRQLASTFNAITVDSDTSTSDTLLVAATGRSAAAEITPDDDGGFETALASVMRDLAHQIVRDGEGASKFIEVRVTGAESAEDARRVAFAIANSPLVKTAVAGEDPNWGRIVAAIGKSGARAERDRLTIRLGDILVAENGFRAPSYAEDAGAAYMKNADIVIAVDLGLGTAERTVWTCDLTDGYIRINADYRS